MAKRLTPTFQWHRLLVEIIPEVLSDQRMHFKQIVSAIHDTYGSVDRRTVHRYVGKLMKLGVVERCGPAYCIDSYYVIASERRSHR